MNDPEKHTITLSATLKRVSSNAETGERQIVLSIPQMDAAAVARLSLYDEMVFKVTFEPEPPEEFN